MQSYQGILLETNLRYTQKHTLREESEVCRADIVLNTLIHQNRKHPLFSQTNFT